MMAGRSSVFVSAAVLTSIACLAGIAIADESNAGEATPGKLTMDVPAMKEVAAKAGIDQSYEGPWEYFVGGGAAGLDCNGDRKTDLFIAGGTNPAKLYVNQSTSGGDLRFANKKLDLPDKLLTGVTGAYPLDVDNDGQKDLVILRVGPNKILKGGPDCSFTDGSGILAFDGGHDWTTAFAAVFERGSKHPTLAFGNYVDRSAPGSPWGTCHDNYLHRPGMGPNGDLEYSSKYPLSPGYCSLSMIFTDWNRSGQPSLRMTNDRQYYRGGEEQLWRVEPGRFPRPYRRSDGWRRISIWGMGIAEADLDADGFPEYALTSMGDTKLQTLDSDAEEGRPVYRDIAYERGATAHRPYTGESLKPSTGWHAEFADFNNDGNLDLFIAKGNVEQMPEFASFDPDNLLLGSVSGEFREAGEPAGIAKATKGRGAVIDDFNHDGLLDMLIVNRGSPASLFQNTGVQSGSNKNRLIPAGNWLQIELHQDGYNRDAVGARILIKSGNSTRVRTIAVGGGHASGRLGFVHAGLGVAERAEIRIQWPDGEWSPPYRVFANQFVRISRGAPAARYWIPY
ncbi:MAG: CRTAC1 family protein [Rhizobiaceae bacterium]